jgi:hypothetical protein
LFVHKEVSAISTIKEGQGAMQDKIMLRDFYLSPKRLHLALLFGLLVLGCVQSLSKPLPFKDPAEVEAALKKATTEAIANRSLHRLDFRVVGRSCAVCLLSIQRKIKAANGVCKVAVMLKKPYGAVVLYDSRKTAPQQLLDTAKKGERDTKFEDIRDAAINKVPLVLLPIYNSVVKGSENTTRENASTPAKVTVRSGGSR